MWATLAWGIARTLLSFALKPSNLAILGVACMLTYGTAWLKGKWHQDRVWVARIEAEKEKQAQIVFREDNKALAANKKLLEEVEMQNAQINELLAEADTDANAARPALGIDSVQRINRGRARKP